MRTNQDIGILLFVKYPDKGKVKLRLSADLNEQIVQDLYQRFVQDTVTTVEKIDAQLLICFLPVDAQKKFKTWLGSRFIFVPQHGADLGERMKNCFTYAFTKGFRRAILIGSDSPDLPLKFLQKAFTDLETHDMVLGPSSDGGYYLIGFQDSCFEPSLFDDIPWGTASVLAETLQKIHRTKHHLSLLPVWSDVDTLTDLKNLIERNRDTSFKTSQTITYLQQNKILTEDDYATKPKK